MVKNLIKTAIFESQIYKFVPPILLGFSPQTLSFPPPSDPMADDPLQNDTLDPTVTSPLPVSLTQYNALCRVTLVLYSPLLYIEEKEWKSRRALIRLEGVVRVLIRP